MEANTTTQKNTVATTHASLGLSVGQKSKRIFSYQLAAFFLTALVYSISHASRTVWGYAKPYLSTEDPYYTSGKLGFLDFSFMASYAIGQYISGWLGDRVNLKVFVCSGLTCAMTALCLFGCLEGFLLIDSLTIAMFLFIFNGFGQSTAYPGCISIVSNWFTSGKAGLIFGLWGTCLNIGDIIGQQIGSFIINEKGLSWQYALFTTAGIQIFLVIILAIFVKTSPKDLKNGDTRAADALIESPEDHQQNQVSTSHHGHGHRSGRAISFREALQIKNVSFFALGFFCVKGVIYGTMFWLPFYLTKEVGFEGNISLLLASIEIGMLIGSILLGYLSDRINSRAIMISFGFFFSVIFLVFTFLIKELKLKMLYFFLLLLAGVGIGGPASLIGGAVSSDLGQKFAEKNSVNAIATIAGIMEGCGALGAALTQLLVSNFTQITFPFFAFLCLVGGFVMVPVAIHDYRKIKRQQATGEEAESDQEAPRHVRF